MADIVEFLEARIAEDEALARTASVGMHGEHEDAWGWGDYVLGAERDSTPKQDEFITVWWPKRVLAECAAKRAIIPHLQDFTALEALAYVYKDHPGYDKNWRR